MEMAVRALESAGTCPEHLGALSGQSRAEMGVLDGFGGCVAATQLVRHLQVACGFFDGERDKKLLFVGELSPNEISERGERFCCSRDELRCTFDHGGWQRR
jgi:hypothetical protein